MVIQGWCVGSGWLVAIMNIVNEILIDASSDSEHIIHFLKNHPAEVNFVDQDGISALHWFALLRIPLTLSLRAITCRKQPLVEYLVRNGANVNLRSGELQQTPLHLAIKLNSYQGIDPSLTISH
jgi:ankyrin repeat protein